MNIGHTTGTIKYKFGMANISHSDLRNDDPFFGSPNNGDQKSKEDVINTPDIGVYFLSTVIDKSNIINIIFPNGLIQPVEYNVHKFGAWDAEKHFWGGFTDFNGKKPPKGLYIIYNHNMFSRIEINRIKKETHGEYYFYYSEPSSGKFGTAFETFKNEIIDRDLLNKRASIRTIYFIPYEDLVKNGSIYYPELGLTVSLNSLYTGHKYSANVIHKTDTLGYESFIEIIDNHNQYEEYFLKDIDGRIISFISGVDKHRKTGIYMTTLCNGRVVRDEYISNLDDSHKLGIYKTRGEAELSSYNELDVQYKKMELNIAELNNMKAQSEYKLKEAELRNKELEIKNESLELQLSYAKEKYKSDILTIENKIKMEQLNMNFDMVRKYFEWKILNTKFKNEIEKMESEKEMFKLKSTLEMVGSVNKLVTEGLKCKNDFIRSNRDVAISNNNNIKSVIDTGAKVITTFAAFI